MASPRPRLASLDVFRGAAIGSMIVVNTAASREAAYPALLHARWNGWTFADTIFPAFLWIVGVSLTLSTAARIERGAHRASLVWHALRRSILLFACGVALDWITFPTRSFPFVGVDVPAHVQLTGVLQKISVAYFIAFVIFVLATWRGVVAAIVALNAVYLATLFFYPVPGCGAGIVTPDCNFPGYLDRTLLAGHLWHNPPLQDPDALGSLLPAAATVLLGVLAGYVLRAKSPAFGVIRRFGAMGLALALSGVALSFWVPINKPIWTTSYALLMCGISTLCFAACYWLVDVRGWRRWFTPLEILGMNALAAYMLSRLLMNLPKIHIAGKSFYEDVCLKIGDPLNASLLYALAYTAGVLVIVWLMYRQRVFLKL
ncbi:MAG TPA: heparan-alpha-glucosaminide N-acetyltransferase domain-containing protein [Vicinamibacterales bacterium]|nr:heparan-alpha-glucosaminide N-acetyltransferase domain-containing protein [Vicinamibacterales bacterium]